MTPLGFGPAGCLSTPRRATEQRDEIAPFQLIRQHLISRQRARQEDFILRLL
jgi:hypothetical protein